MSEDFRLEPQGRKGPNDRKMFECNRFRSIGTFGQGERVAIGSLHLMKTEEFLFDQPYCSVWPAEAVVPRMGGCGSSAPGASTPQSQGGMKMIYLMQAESKTPTPSASASGSDVHSNGSGVKVTSTPPMVIVT